MSTGDDSRTDRERQVDAAIAWYYQQAEAGSAPDRDAFLARYPDLRPELEAFLADKAAFEHAAAPADPNQTVTLAADESGTDAPAAAPLGTVRYFGDYELQAEIARGGMGVVYRARQVSLNRVVALKMILAGQLASEADVQRFRQEAESAANLDHPNILPIYEVGEHHGQQYFSMKLIEGGSLGQRLQASPTADVRGFCTQLGRVARAVHYAHQRGLLHRDLKPANILLDPDGTPYVTDFGLAKRVEGESGLTQSGALLGTPSYMAPEQARAEKQLSTGVDVYSLGAILYEALTGRPPFRGETVYDTIRQVLERDPEDPRKLNPKADRDLAVIALKCLAKEPGKRYESAAALADDLDRWQRGEPIVARPAGPRERLVKWVRRNPVPAAFTGLTLFLLIAGLTAVSLMYFRAEGYRTEAERERDRARDRLARQYVEKAAALADAGNPLGGLPWLVEALQLNEWGQQADLHRIHLAAVLNAAPGLVHFSPTAPCAALHPDGQRIAIGEKTGVRLYRLGEDQPLVPDLTLGGPPSTVVFRPDGRRVLVASGVGGAGMGPWQPTLARVFDVDSGSPIGPEVKIGRAKDGATALRFSDDGSVVVAVWQGHVNRHVVNTEVYLYDATTLAPIGKPLIWGHPEGLDYIHLDYRNLRALTQQDHMPADSQEFSWPVRIRVWDLRTGKPQFEPLQAKEGTTAGPLSPDGSRFVLWGLKEVRVYDATTGQPATPTMTHPANVTSVAFRPDGASLATLDSGGGLRLWDVRTGQPDRLPGRDLSVGTGWRRVNFSPDGRLVYVAGGNGLAAYDPAAEITRTHQQVFLVGEDQTRTETFSPDGLHLAVADWEGVRVWRRSRGTVVPYLPHGGWVECTFSPDGRYLLTTGNGVRVWDLARSNPASRPFLPPRLVPTRHTAIAPAADRVAVLDIEGHCQVFDARTGEALSPAHRLPGDWREVGLSLDGKYLYTQGWAEGRSAEPTAAELSGRVCGGHGNYIWKGPRDLGVWDAATGKPIVPPLRHRTIGEVLVHPDGKTLLVAGRYLDYKRAKQLGDPSDDYTEFSLWDLESGEERRPVLRLPGHYYPIEFTPTGDRLLMLVPGGRSEDARDSVFAQFWLVDELSPEGGRYGPPAGKVVQAALSRYGDRVLTVNASGEAEVWDRTSSTRVAGPFRHTSPRVGHRPPLSMAAFSPDGRHVVTTTGVHYGSEGEARIWDVDTGKPATPVLRHHSWVRYATFSSDGRLLATLGVGKDGWEVRLWDADTGMPVSPPLGVPVHHSAINETQVRDLSGRPRFTPDGGRLLIPTPDAAGLIVIDLRRENRPPAELEPLAQLLSGHEVDATGNFQSLAEVTAAAATERWRKLHPGGRAGQTPEAARTYRERQARAAVAADAWDPARVWLAECLNDQPGSAWLREQQATAHERLGRWDEALAHRTEAIRRADHPHLRARQGEILAGLGRFPEAAREFDIVQARTGQPADVASLALARWASQDRAGYRQACAVLRERLAELPKNSEILTLAALACGLDPEAPDLVRPFIPILEALRAVEVGDTDLLWALVLGHLRTGSPDKVAPLLKDYPPGDGYYNRHHVVLALARSQLGMPPAADFLKKWDDWYAREQAGLHWRHRVVLASLRRELASP